MKTNEVISNFPAYYYNNELTEKICFAKSDDEVKVLINSIN